jgi:hypothetical protein
MPPGQGYGSAKKSASMALAQTPTTNGLENNNNAMPV